MELINGATVVMGVVAIFCGFFIAGSAFLMPVSARRGRRLLRLFKAALVLYTGFWWVFLGLNTDFAASVSRVYLRPAFFLLIVSMSISIHYDNVAPFVNWALHPFGARK